MPFFLSQILPSTLFHLTLSTADAKRSNNPGSSHWGHRRGHSPSLSPLCLHPASYWPEIQMCKTTPLFRKPSLPSQDQWGRREAGG